MSSSVRDLLEASFADEKNIIGTGNGIVFSLLGFDDYVIKSNEKYAYYEQLANSTILHPTPQPIGSRNMGQSVMRSRNSEDRFKLEILQKQDGDSLSDISVGPIIENGVYQGGKLNYLQHIKFLNSLSVEVYKNAVHDLNRLDSIGYLADTNNIGNVLYSKGKLSIIDFFTEHEREYSTCSPSILLDAVDVSLYLHTQENARILQDNKRGILYKVLEAFTEVGAPNNLPVHPSILNHSDELLSSQGFTSQDREQYNECVAGLKRRSKPVDTKWLERVHDEAGKQAKKIPPIKLDEPVDTMVERLEQVRETQKTIDKLHDEPRR